MTRLIAIFVLLLTATKATLTYGYDANGNRTGETYSNVPPAVLNKASRSLDYDAQDRLTKQELADGNKQTWTLSAVGNWTQTQLNQDPAQTRTHTATHQIVSMAGTALSYDAKGNMTTDQRGYVYRWDHENRLIEVLGPPVVESATTQPDANTTPGSTTQPEDPYADPNAVSTPTSQPTTQPTIAWRQTYTYDAMGRRVSRTTYQNEVASTTVYVSAGMQEVAEYTDSSDAAAPSRTYVYGSYVDEPVQVRVFASATTQPASTQSATTQPSYTDYYYHTNALYSVIAVSDTAGTVVERYTYDAYGQRMITDADGTPRAESILGNEIGFTGRRLDPLTNQYYFRARYYDATQGRFISRDPLEYVDGMSLYGGYYVPNGLDPEGKTLKFIGLGTKDKQKLSDVDQKTYNEVYAQFVKDSLVALNTLMKGCAEVAIAGELTGNDAVVVKKKNTDAEACKSKCECKEASVLLIELVEKDDKLVFINHAKLVSKVNNTIKDLIDRNFGSTVDGLKRGKTMFNIYTDPSVSQQGDFVVYDPKDPARKTSTETIRYDIVLWHELLHTITLVGHDEDGGDSDIFTEKYENGVIRKCLREQGVNVGDRIGNYLKSVKKKSDTKK